MRVSRRLQSRSGDKPSGSNRWGRRLEQTVDKNWIGEVDSFRESEIARELAHAEVLQARISDAQYAIGGPHVVVQQAPDRSRLLVTLGVSCLSPLLVLLVKTLGHDRIAAVLGLISLTFLLRSLCIGFQIVNVSKRGTKEKVALAWAPSFTLLSVYSVGLFDSWGFGEVNRILSIGLLVVMLGIQFGASLIFTGIFDPTWDEGAFVGWDAIVARNRGWLADLRPKAEIQQLEGRLDLAFGFFSAATLALGSFLWMFADEGRYLLTFVALVFVCEIGWLVLLGRWEVAVSFEKKERSAGWNVVRVMFAFAPLAIAGLLLDVEGPNSPEGILFYAKVLVLLLTTLVPVIVTSFLKMVVRPVLGLTRFGHAVGSEPFLVVDQLVPSLSIGKGPWPLLRMRYRAVTDVVVTTANCAVEPVIWESVWARRGVAGDWRYKYSIVWEGDRFYIYHLEGKYRRATITWAKRFREKTCGKQSGVPAAYVPVTGGSPIRQPTDFQLCTLRVPPLVPGGKILQGGAGAFSAGATELVALGPGETVYLVAQKNAERAPVY